MGENSPGLLYRSLSPARWIGCFKSCSELWLAGNKLKLCRKSFAMDALGDFPFGALARSRSPHTAKRYWRWNESAGAEG